MTQSFDIDSVKFVKDFYPRFEFDNETVNSYRLAIDDLPPIIVTQEGFLVDGYHRFVAHKLEGRKEIAVEIVDIPQDRILWEATKRNADHGKQLSMKEKRFLARQFYENNGVTQVEIKGVLSVSESTLSNWLSDLVREAKEQQKQQIIDLYLQCSTYEEICTKLSVSKSTISELVQKLKNEFLYYAPDSLQLFNVWYFPNRDKQYGLDFKGAIPGQIVENVLYYFTEPFDVVVDPMAGGGTTIDVCKALKRRYRAYDINPMREDIAKHDITQGFPKECNNCDLIFLDPPYFNMVFDTFKDVNRFYGFVEKLVKDCFSTVKPGGIVALLMQDMTEKGNYCLSGECYRIFRQVGFETIAHISCPLTTQQWIGRDINWAKENKIMLGRNRDLYVFRRSKNG